LPREAFVRIRIRTIPMEWGRIERAQLVGAISRMVIASAEARLVA